MVEDEDRAGGGSAPMGGGAKPRRAGCGKAKGPSGMQRAALSVTPEQGATGLSAPTGSAAPASTWRAMRGRVDLACMRVVLVRYASVRANTYNPNSVPREKLELLAQSIADNGFCFPAVVIRDPDLSAAEGEDVYVIVDGFHRWTVGGPEWLAIDPFPVVVLAHDYARRLAATWQFNKARGHHRVDLDADLVTALAGQGLEDGEIATRLGIDLDTVLRYRQVAGAAALFANAALSPAWAVAEGGEADAVGPIDDSAAGGGA